MGVGLFLATFFDFGMATLLLRVRAVGTDAEVKAIRLINGIGAAILAIVGGAATAVVVLMAGETPQLAAASATLIVSAAIEKNADTLLAIPIADGRTLGPSVSVLGRRLVALAGFLALLWVCPSPVSFALASTAGALSGRLFIVGSLPRLGAGRPARLSAILRRSWPFLIGNVSAQVRSLDVLIVAGVSGVAAAGLYSVSLRLANPLLVVPTTLASIVLPRVARGGIERARREAIKWSAVAVSASFGSLVSLPIAPSILSWVFGQEYAAAGGVLSALLAGIPIVGLSSILGAILQGLGAESFVALNGVVFALVFIVLALCGAVILGALGLALGMVLAYLLKCISLGRRVVIFA